MQNNIATKNKKTLMASWQKLFPIKSNELSRFIPVASMMLLIIMNYSLLRSIKDAIIIKNQFLGPEALNFIKSWFVFPVATLMMFSYIKLSHKLNREKLFQVVIVFFAAFFALYLTILEPFAQSILPSASTITRLQTQYPNFYWLIAMYGQWSYCLMHVIADLWNPFCLNLAFGP